MSLPAPTLSTARLRLRHFIGADADALFALHSNAHVLRYWDSPPWTDPARAERFIAVCRRVEEDGSVSLVVAGVVVSAEEDRPELDDVGRGRIVPALAVDPPRRRRAQGATSTDAEALSGTAITPKNGASGSSRPQGSRPVFFPRSSGMCISVGVGPDGDEALASDGDRKSVV